MYEKSYCFFMKNLNFVFMILLYVFYISVMILFFSLEKIYVILLLWEKNCYIMVYVIKVIVIMRNVFILL